MKQINEFKRMQQLAGILKENVEMDTDAIKMAIDNIVNDKYKSKGDDLFAEWVKEYTDRFIDKGVHLGYLNNMSIEDAAQKLVIDAEDTISAEMDSPDVDNPIEPF